MRGFKLKLLNAFFVYLLIVIIVSLYFFYSFKADAYGYILVSFLIISTFFVIYLRMFFLKVNDFINRQLETLTAFIEKGELTPLEDPMFENLHNELLLKSEEIKKLIYDIIDTNSLVKTRINDVVYSFGELIEDFKGFNKKFRDMMDFISSVSGEKLDLEVEDKLKSFVELTVEISRFKEQLTDLVEKVKDIVNFYILKTSEDIKNANFVIKGFLSFSESLVLNIDKIVLFFNNLGSYSEKLSQEIGKIENHRDTLMERVNSIRDNFDRERDLFDEIAGINKTINDIFYQLKTTLLEVSSLNKKASLMSLNALIYASETSGENKKFGTVAKELKRIVEEVEKKYSVIDSFFSDLFEKNNYSLKLLSGVDEVAVKNRVELSKIANDLEHLSHHTKMSRQSYVNIIEPVEENITFLNSLKEGIINHSSSLKGVLIVMQDYLSRLNKAEKDKESFDSLVVNTSSLLEYINNTLPSIINYITVIFKNFEDFSKELQEANDVIERFNNDKAIKEFGALLDDLQHKRLANLKNSLVLLDKVNNIKKIL